MARFFVPHDEWQSGTLRLSPAESRHASQVLRLGVGEQVTVFDGTGRIAEAEILGADRRAVTVRLLRERRVGRVEPGVHLIVALIKGERFDWLVQKATELGAASIRPVSAARSVVRLAPPEAARRREKWVQVAIEAAKQCGHVVLPEILPVASPAEAFAAAPVGAKALPALRPGGVSLGAFLAPAAGETTFAIGPEGDWSEAEAGAALASGFTPVDLGRHVLRSETAALHVLSVASHHLHDSVGGRNPAS